MFLHVTLVLSYGRKTFLAWTEHSDAKHTGWSSMCNCFNWLQDSSNYSAGVLQTNVVKNMSSITGRGIKSQTLYITRHHVFYIMATMYPLFSYCSTIDGCQICQNCKWSITMASFSTGFNSTSHKAAYPNQPASHAVIYRGCLLMTTRALMEVWHYSKTSHSKSSSSNFQH